MTLKTRPPTGRVPWPLILIEGGEKSGKSWACAVLSASPRVGQTYWIDLGEGSADEYGAIPGVRYCVVEHDGSFGAILASVVEIKAEAARAAEAGEPPVVLVIDSVTAEWELLKDWAGERARRRLASKGKRVPGADEEVQISMDLWNDATARHRRLMTLLITFPGIVLLTARGKDVAALDTAGRPIENTKEYKVEGQKSLAFDATLWLRLARDARPTVIGARSVHTGIRPGIDEPKKLDADWSLEWLIFEALRCDPATAHVRDLVNPNPIEPEPAPPGEMTEQRQKALHGALREAELADREKGLAYISEAIGRRVESTKELTAAEFQKVMRKLDSYIRQNNPAVESEAAAA
jgi:hypothetical protein